MTWVSTLRFVENNHGGLSHHVKQTNTELVHVLDLLPRPTLQQAKEKAGREGVLPTQGPTPNLLRVTMDAMYIAAVRDCV